MHDDEDRDETPKQPPSDEDEARTKEARRVLEDYAAQLRGLLEKLRKHLD